MSARGKQWADSIKRMLAHEAELRALSHAQLVARALVAEENAERWAAKYNQYRDAFLNVQEAVLDAPVHVDIIKAEGYDD